jgi:hypothetical protein
MNFEVRLLSSPYMAQNCLVGISKIWISLGIFKISSKVLLPRHNQHNCWVHDPTSQLKKRLVSKISWEYVKQQHCTIWQVCSVAIQKLDERCTNVNKNPTKSEEKHFSP